MLFWGMTLLSLLVGIGGWLLSGGAAGMLWLVPVAFLGSFLFLLLVAFLFIWVVCLCIDQKKPQTHDSKFHRNVAYLYADLLITLGRIRIHTSGLEQTPQSGRFLLVCNHISDIDPGILLAKFKKSQLAFISKRENTSMFLVGPMMHKLMCQPLNRENDREALKTILNCIRLIKEDEVSIAVFPEGYICGDELLRHLKPGVFKIAQKAQVPIVVCTIKGARRIFGNLKKLKPSDVDLHLLKTIQPEEYAGMTTVDIASWVYQLMAEDLGPELIAQE